MEETGRIDDELSAHRQGERATDIGPPRPGAGITSARIEAAVR